MVPNVTVDMMEESGQGQTICERRPEVPEPCEFRTAQPPPGICPTRSMFQRPSWPPSMKSLVCSTTPSPRKRRHCPDSGA